MTTDFRSLCAELTEFVARLTKHYYEPAELLTRARAALADEPAVPEGREPVSVTGQPSDEELRDLWSWAAGQDRGSWPTQQHCFARAVLARWGTSNLAEVRSSLGDGEVAELISKLQRLCADLDYDDRGEDAGCCYRAAELLQELEQLKGDLE